ncbi:MAG TPA: caspase family protein [Anaeromyxobacter sp.]
MMARAALAALLLFPFAAQAARFAVIAGNDHGDAGRPRLWFAEKDAERMHHALRELGDFDSDGLVLLRGKRPAALESAVRSLEPRIRAAAGKGERTLLLVYYSGHASGGGLEMDGERLTFEKLRALVADSGADAKIAVVDSCEAGLLTQVKGATPVPAIAFPMPGEDEVSGTAYVASTAVGELAQESAALGGSFFTHHLEVALRGAGDADGDGRVTLSEAFRYTAARTKAGTAATPVGTQHPTYDFKMSGRGDIVLTDLRRAEARLLVPPDPGSTIVLSRGRTMFAEIPGQPTEMTIAMPAGDYRVERRSPSGRATGQVTLVSGRTSELPRLEPTRYELARAKGGPKPGLTYLGAGATWLGVPGFGVAPTGRVALRQEVGPLGVRVRLDYASTSVKDQWLKYDFSYVGGALAALYPLNVGRILVEGGLEGGYGYATQRLAETGHRSFAAGVSSLGAALLVTAPVGSFRAGLDVSAGAQLFKLNGKLTVRPGASAALLVLYGF